MSEPFFLPCCVSVLCPSAIFKGKVNSALASLGFPFSIFWAQVKLKGLACKSGLYFEIGSLYVGVHTMLQ